ncbi:unnamed protein product [Acanthoscelides obtectus]|uniref:Uncharacterized protein n=1 Tax=Acanthoscelides obtectus TaxID=200917 RepID=A0A9P0L8G2_ACAOB|nr:unnamed protein product [Acanthoscelides obtectus]CAK1636526.1 hypothetical protein AOBTE_LOCUS9872 [Acanthoscelides obtectus]
MVLGWFYDAIARIFGDDSKEEELGDPLDFDSGPFLDCGISWVYTFKKLLLPREFRPNKKICPSRCRMDCGKSKRVKDEFTCKT